MVRSMMDETRFRRSILIAPWTQPQEAQEPQEIMALQSAATSLSCSTKGRPPMMQLMPSWLRGGLPSTARMELPLYLCRTSSRIASA